jgi:hypothetical protein
MNTVDKVVEVQEVVETKRKPGRPARQDKTTPMGDFIAEEAKRARGAKEKNPVVDKYYELAGSKLLLCKQVKSGTVYRTLIGSIDDKKSGKEIQAFMKKQQAEGKLRVRV